MGGQPALPDEGQLRTYGLVRNPEGYYSHPKLTCSSCSPNSCLFTSVKPVDKPRTGSTRPYVHIPKCVRCIGRSICSAVQYDRPKHLQSGKDVGTSNSGGADGRKEGEKERGKEGSQRGKYKFYPPRFPGGSMVRKMEDQDEETERLLKKRKTEEGKGAGSGGRQQAGMSPVLSTSASPDQSSGSNRIRMLLGTPIELDRPLTTGIKVEHQDSTRSPSITPIYRRSEPDNESPAGTYNNQDFDFPVPLTPTNMVHHKAAAIGTGSIAYSLPQIYTRPAAGRTVGIFRSLSPDSDGESPIKSDADNRRQNQQDIRDHVGGVVGGVTLLRKGENEVRKPEEAKRTSESYASESIDILTDSSSSPPAQNAGTARGYNHREPSTIARSKMAELIKPPSGPSPASAFADQWVQDMKHETALLEKKLEQCEPPSPEKGDHSQCLETLGQERLSRLEAEKKVVQLESELRRKDREVREANSIIEELKENAIKQKEKTDERWRRLQDLAMSSSQAM